MTGKSRQPSHEPQCKGEKKTGTRHTDKTVERKGGTREGRWREDREVEEDGEGRESRDRNT